MFRLEIPPTPPSSDVRLSGIPNPVALTHAHAASWVQPLSNGRVLFTQSSFTSPNDVFLLSGLDALSDPVVEQITRLSEHDLQRTHLDEGEQYWVEGADGKMVQSWILKPKGFKKNDTMGGKWPVVFLVHGGPQGKRKLCKSRGISP